MMDPVYLYDLAANLSFAVGVLLFTHYARRVSSLWVNCFKGLVAAVLFASVFECAVEKKRPSSYLAAAFVFFPGGMALLFG